MEYTARVTVGIQIEPETFFYDEKETRTVVCAHSEAAGNRFCPKCGLAKKDRVMVKKVRTVKAPFVGLVDLNTEWGDCPVAVGDLAVIQVSYNPYGEGILALGLKVGEAGGYDSNVVQEPAADTVRTIERVSAALQALGITQMPKTFLSLNAS